MSDQDARRQEDAALALFLGDNFGIGPDGERALAAPIPISSAPTPGPTSLAPPEPLDDNTAENVDRWTRHHFRERFTPE
jgi:hypothetical protein